MSYKQPSSHLKNPKRGRSTGDADFVRRQLADARKRYAAASHEIEATAALTTPEGVRGHAGAKAVHEVHRKQLVYWEAEAAKVGDVGK